MKIKCYNVWSDAIDFIPYINFWFKKKWILIGWLGWQIKITLKNGE